MNPHSRALFSACPTWISNQGWFEYPEKTIKQTNKPLPTHPRMHARASMVLNRNKGFQDVWCQPKPISSTPRPPVHLPQPSLVRTLAARVCASSEEISGWRQSLESSASSVSSSLATRSGLGRRPCGPGVFGAGAILILKRKGKPVSLGQPRILGASTNFDPH